MTTIVLGFFAGVLATLSPCVLPLIPIVLGSALDRHRLAPLALTAGFAVAFAVIGISVGMLGFGIGIDGETLRPIAAGVMILFGVVLMSTALQSRLAAAGTRAMTPAMQWVDRFRPEGVAGHAALGALLGAVWAPCTGPVMGATLGLAAQRETAPAAAAVMAAFALGSAAPFLAIGYASRSGLARQRARLAAVSARVKPIMGVAIAAIGVAVLTGADKTVEAAILDQLPLWWVDLTVRI